MGKEEKNLGFFNSQKRKKAIEKISQILKFKKRTKNAPNIDKIDKEVIKAFRINKFFLDEIVRNKVPECDISGWLKVKNKIGQGFIGEIYEVCIPKEKCKETAILKKTFFRNSEAKKAFRNETITFDYIWGLQSNLKNDPVLKKVHKIDYRHFVLQFHHWEGCSEKIKGENVKIGYQLLEKGGDNFENVIKKKRSDKWWLNVLGQILSIIDDMNEIKVNHNDLHLGNLVVFNENSSKNVILKVIDFGSATISSKQIGKELHKQMSFLGSRYKEKTPGFIKNRDLIPLIDLLVDISERNMKVI